MPSAVSFVNLMKGNAQMTIRHALRDEQWAKIKDLLPGQEGMVGVTANDNRLFVDAVIYRYKTGIPWRDIPERFGDFRVVHLRFSRWAKRGVWEIIFKILAADADNEYGMIDSTVVRAHQHSAGAIKKEGEDQAIGRSKGGLSTKIHATVDALGNPTGFYLTGGQACDLEGADALMPILLEADSVLADKAYDADERMINPLQQAGKTIVIPSKKNRKTQRAYDKVLYQARHLVENFFVNSNSSVPLPLDMIKPLVTSWPQFTSSQASFCLIDDRP